MVRYWPGKVFILATRSGSIQWLPARIPDQVTTSYLMKTPAQTDQDLLERARRFDRQALAEIYDRYSPGLYRYALHLLGNPDVAEECIAETFSRFLHVLKSGKGPQDYLQAYLFRVARNWISDLFRREKPVEELQEERWPDISQDPEASADLGFRHRRLSQAIRQLTPDQQQVILLKFGEGWENEDIARSLRKPIGAIKSLQHRALVRLQKLLEEPE